MKNKEESVKKRPSRAKKILFWVIVSVMFLIGVLCFGAAYVLNNIDRGSADMNHENLGIHEGLSNDVKNVALFGVDARDDKVAGRSDAMMIVSFDFKHHKVKVVSLMRDSLVDIAGYGKKKLNSAYALGGVELAIKTINRNFKMNITDYVSVNFNQMARIVDALGGVEVEITEAERKNANKYIREMAQELGEEPDLIEKSGRVTLYGFQAVSYSRIRYVGNADFRRTERQREVMEKLMNKALELNPVKYPSVIMKILPLIETSMTNEELMKIAGQMVLFGKPAFEQGRFPLDGSYVSNSSYSMIYDLDAAAEKLHSFIYDDVAFYNTEE